VFICRVQPVDGDIEFTERVTFCQLVSLLLVHATMYGTETVQVTPLRRTLASSP